MVASTVVAVDSTVAAVGSTAVAVDTVVVDTGKLRVIRSFLVGKQEEERLAAGAAGRLFFRPGLKSVPQPAFLARMCGSRRCAVVVKYLHRSQETDTLMAYVIAEPCINTKDTACVDACPVDCIHPKKDDPKYATEPLLYIDPVECIDCGACVPVCPVSAIFALDDLPEKWNEFTAKNAAYYGR